MLKLHTHTNIYIYIYIASWDSPNSFNKTITCYTNCSRLQHLFSNIISFGCFHKTLSNPKQIWMKIYRFITRRANRVIRRKNSTTRPEILHVQIKKINNLFQLSYNSIGIFEVSDWVILFLIFLSDWVLPFLIHYNIIYTMKLYWSNSK